MCGEAIELAVERKLPWREWKFAHGCPQQVDHMSPFSSIMTKTDNLCEPSILPAVCDYQYPRTLSILSADYLDPIFGFIPLPRTAGSPAMSLSVTEVLEPECPSLFSIADNRIGHFPLAPTTISGNDAALGMLVRPPKSLSGH